MSKTKMQQTRERIAIEGLHESHPAGSPQVTWAPPPLGEEIGDKALGVHPKARLSYHKGRLFLYIPTETGVQVFEQAASSRTKTVIVGNIIDSGNDDLIFEKSDIITL